MLKKKWAEKNVNIYDLKRIRYFRALKKCRGKRACKIAAKRYNVRMNYLKQVDNISKSIFGISVDTLVDAKKHDKYDFSLGRALAKAWLTNCGPLKESFWAKFPYMMDKINSYSHIQRINHLKGLAKKCAETRIAEANKKATEIKAKAEIKAEAVKAAPAFI